MIAWTVQDAGHRHISRCMRRPAVSSGKVKLSFKTGTESRDEDSARKSCTRVAPAKITDQRPRHRKSSALSWRRQDLMFQKGEFKSPVYLPSIGK